MIMSIIIIDFTNKAENYREFVFKLHQYVIVKKSLTLKSIKQKLYINSKTFMSLIN